ncbi:MAG TPA: thioesterase family protein [Propionibacteriaceae bacterium]|nr:thioesterase family protein [Propionibacteriaceae bacterium]
MSLHVYRCPTRWGDMDAQGHINNAAYVDYLQEARVDFLLAGPPEGRVLLDDGVLVVSHQVEYVRPISFGGRPLVINLWVDQIGGSRFTIGYDLFDGDDLAARARSGLVPFDLAGNALRRLTDAERTMLTRHLAPAEPLRSVPKAQSSGHDHHFPLRVRWSDLDSYGHANNVKFYDYIQEARIALIHDTVGWQSNDVWMVARQDVEYRLPLDFRPDPYEVGTFVSAIGSRSFTLEAAIRDPGTGTVYATARTVAVGVAPLTEAQRSALAAWSTRPVSPT